MPPHPRRDVAAPAFQTWELDTALAEAANWGKIRAGIWDATPGTTRSIKGDTFEFCHILSGHVDVVPAWEPEWQGDPFTLRRALAA